MPYVNNYKYNQLPESLSTIPQLNATTFQLPRCLLIRQQSFPLNLRILAIYIILSHFITILPKRRVLDSFH